MLPIRQMLVLLLICCLTTPSTVCQAQVEKKDANRREKVLNAIELAQRALMSRQNVDGGWTGIILGQYEIGVTGLVTLALVNSGIPPKDERIQNAVKYLTRAEPTKTYDISMALMALVAAGEGKVEAHIRRMAQQLEDLQRRGGDGGNWGYGEDGGDWWDNSNTQFAVLALREAAHYGVEVERDIWRRAQEHFLRTQRGPRNSPQGSGWSYQNTGGATGSMTVAGLASLTITHAMLQDDQDDVTRDGEILCCVDIDSEAEEAIKAGELWLSTHFRISSNPNAGSWLLYYLYGLERAGRFTGRRFFGDHDWYREGVDFLIPGQGAQGVWRSQAERDDTIGTSLALLFLSKGLSPVLVNKLKYGPRDPDSGDTLGKDWNLHSRDITNLVDYTTTRPLWPKLLTWQTVDLKQAVAGEGVAALLQSPVQFMSGSDSPDAIQGAELELLREYIAQGGFVFAVQNCESAAFDRGFRELVQRLFEGQYELRKLPPTHDVYRSENVFREAPPELWGVDFGCRTAIIYAPFDHACRWNKWVRHTPPDRHQLVTVQIDKSMKLGLNVIAYATGRELQDKLKRPEILASVEQTTINRGRLTIARVRHTGGWDTAPHALSRLQAALETVGIESAAETPNLAANDPAIFDYPILYMHGRKNFQLSDQERSRLQSYLDNGGFLFADACCGSKQFDDSFRDMVQKMYGRPLVRIPATHELHNMQLGYDIRKVTRRLPPDDPQASSLATTESEGEAILEGIEINGKYAIVYSKYDLSCALERQATTACVGYKSEDAARIGVNLVLYGLFQ